MHEMPTIDVRPDLWEIVRNILKKHVPQHEVWAFGSRVKWTAKEYSDLDLAIITDEPLSFSTSAALREDFSESDLPWRVDFLDWATTGESFREVVARDKVVVQTAEQWPTMTSEWRKTLLGEVFEVNPSRSLKRGSIAPFIPMEALPQHARSVERIAVREYTSSGMRFRNGDTLVARITPCLENGKTAFVSGLPGNQIAHGSTEYIVLSGKQGETDSLFAYYLARTPEFRQYAINHMEGTSGRQRVSASTIKQYPVDLPPLAEQQAIAHILGTLDDRIDNLRQSNATLEAMARALFKSWFVDFDGVPPEDMQESELGLIPKGWRVGTLGDVAAHPRRSVQPEEVESATPYIALEHMPKRCIALSDWGMAFGLESSKHEFKRGEILFGKLRPYFHKVGVAPIDGVCSTDIVVIAPKSSAWFGFVLAHASSNEFVEYTNAGSTGTKMPRTNWSQMSRYAVVLPPESIAAEFNHQVQKMAEKIISNIHMSRTLIALRDTLLPRLISGRLRIDGLTHES